MKGPLSFSVNHEGRGGMVTCRTDTGQVELALEMAGNGFCVWVRGARVRTLAGKHRHLRPAERQLLLDELRAWLDKTQRANWLIEV